MHALKKKRRANCEAVQDDHSNKVCCQITRVIALLEVMAGFHRKQRNVWPISLTVYGLLAILAQAVVRHVPAQSGNQTQWDNHTTAWQPLSPAITWRSDVVYVFMLLLYVARLVQISNYCSTICQLRAARVVGASMMLTTAAVTQIWGQIGINHDHNNQDFSELLVASNTLLAVIVSGAPIKLASSLAQISWLRLVFELPLRLFFEVLRCCCLNRSGTEQLNYMRQQITYLADQLLFVAVVVGCIVGACLWLPSIVENTAANLGYLRIAQVIAAVAISSAFLAPSAAFLALLVQSVECRVKRFQCNGLAAVQLTSLVAVASLALASIVQEVRFVYFQQK